MKQLMIAAVRVMFLALCSAVALSCSSGPPAPAPIAVALAADLDRLTGEPWKGTLTYLDFTRNEPATIRSSLGVQRLQTPPLSWSIQVGYTDEPAANGGSRLTLSADGQRLGEEALLERFEAANGLVRIVTEIDGEDNGSLARLRYVYTIEDNRFSIQKLVRPEGAPAFFERNVYHWHRGPVDLRAEFESLGLGPRPQGGRGTCSVFTTCSALEWAIARQRNRPERLSAEFLNWAASQAAGGPSDGAFFHNALAGFERFGLCAESSMPYSETYDASLAPSPEALAEGEELLRNCRAGLVVHWIVPWVPNRFGLSDAEFDEVKAVLARGYPVAAGSGHSRLLVGYREDPALPGGGAFLTMDSALARFDEVSYDFVRKEVADVFWVEAF
jgi:hypothetical protein